jgi:hypothetical protein
MSFEGLEPRLLLSGHHGHHHNHKALAAAKITTTPNAGIWAPFALTRRVDHSGSHLVTPTATAGPAGYTPARFRNAYAMNGISFNGITGDGRGQTIAIVDAYNSPTIQADLKKFDAQFGLVDPPSFKVVSQTGSTTALPPVDPVGAGKNNWELETALDVEWAHAIAPMANLLLVEANDSGLDSMIAGAVDYARKQPGVVAVSMSWGAGEWSGELSFDNYFTTPAGHAPVTFLAATGDAASPASYPAYSPNVVAVGGTSLTSDSTGNYVSENGWSSGGGGVSAYEPQPAYQHQPGAVTVVSQDGSFRTTPDVSIAADPNKGGVSIYDSYNNGTATPWSNVGGTSLSTPVWAGLVAIIDQGRAAQSPALAPIDGAAELLPRLYNTGPGAFHDVVNGNNGFAAASGYDLVTGIGSPISNVLVPSLVGGVFDAVIDNNKPVYTSVSSLPVVFSQPIDATTFTASSVDLQGLDSAGGSLDLSNIITSVSLTDPTHGTILFSPGLPAGTYQLTLSGVTDVAGDTLPGGAVVDNFQVVASVVTRAVFYNNSSYDGSDSNADVPTDANAIATDKLALLPGHQAAFENYTSYGNGINGIIVDLSGATTATLGATDFSFLTGVSSDLTTWTVPAAPTITVFPGMGAGGSDRVEIIFADQAIRNQWLQVTVKATVGTTNLSADDVFYFGNLVGETGNTAAGNPTAVVTISDIAATKSKNGTTALITSNYDFNRDGRISISDIAQAKSMNGQSLQMITV